MKNSPTSSWKGNKGATLVADGFEQVGLTGPRAALTNAGARWVNLTVVSDRNLVMSRKPADIPAFNKRVLRLIAGVN